MATFRVGQRVRLARPAQPQNMGLEGVVKCVGEELLAGSQLADGAFLPFDCDVGVDWAGCDRTSAQHSSQLEPIIPEGAAPSEFTTLANLLSSLEVTA